MKNRGCLKTLAIYLCSGFFTASALAAEPLNLTIPKVDPETEPRIFLVNPNNLTSGVLFVLGQIERKIERSAMAVPWPRLDSGKRVYGSVRIAITIRMDGSVMEIEPTSNGLINDQLLIEAATRIIELDAPFPPLPKEHFPGIDAIRFTRTFNFNKGEKTIVN